MSSISYNIIANLNSPPGGAFLLFYIYIVALILEKWTLLALVN